MGFGPVLPTTWSRVVCLCGAGVRLLCNGFWGNLISRPAFVDYSSCGTVVFKREEK
jgi:hypothetical protein